MSECGGAGAAGEGACWTGRIENLCFVIWIQCIGSGENIDRFYNRKGPFFKLNFAMSKCQLRIFFYSMMPFCALFPFNFYGLFMCLSRTCGVVKHRYIIAAVLRGFRAKIGFQGGIGIKMESL